MNDQDIQQLFQKLKDDQDFGRTCDADESWKLVAKRAGLSLQRPVASYGFRDYMEFYVWKFTHAMVKPTAAALAVFVFAITGWVSAANMAGSALPGDELYKVKLGMERAQLALAFSPDQRAALQVEFANRRLEEMVVVAALRSDDEPEVVQLAVERAKTEVSNIQEDLSSENVGQTETELAKALGRKAEVYKTTVATTPDLPEDVQEEVEQIIEETEEQAVQVIITAHELTEDAEAEHELAIAFEKDLERIREEYGEEVQEQIDLAIELQREGLYRRAFQVLKEIETPEIEAEENGTENSIEE